MLEKRWIDKTLKDELTNQKPETLAMGLLSDMDPPYLLAMNCIGTKLE